MTRHRQSHRLEAMTASMSRSAGLCCREEPETTDDGDSSPQPYPYATGRIPAAGHATTTPEDGESRGPAPATHADASKEPPFSHWRDILLVVIVIALAEIFCDHYNVAETLRRLTKPYEHLQLDELPVVALVAALALAWFAWRRYREARRELCGRRSAEAALAATLDDNRRLARRYIDAQEVERRSLARELHDELGQYLNAIKLDAVAIAAHGRETPAGHRARGIVDSVDHVHRSVQTLIRRFRPVALDELGLAAALENSVDHWRRLLPDTALEFRIDGDVDHFGEEINLALYRLVQEALTNISRHARARRASIGLQQRGGGDGSEDGIRLTIRDDGIGTNLGARRGCGLGLIGMRERVQMLDGSFEIASAPGRGFTLSVQLPVARRAVP